MTRSAILLATLLFVPSVAAAAPRIERACGTPEPTAAELQQSRAALKRVVEEGRADRAPGGTIRVAIHVIHSGAEGNVSDAAIDAQMRELNRGFAGTSYRFTLASVDRTDNASWFKMSWGAEKSAKQALAIDPAHTLNIYLCSPGHSLLGWAYYPFSAPEDHWIHGVVAHYGTLPGGFLTDYNLGRTVTHEVGHYLGLYHTFQGGCTAPGDQVDDTPYEATSTSGCPTNKDTCPSAGLDPVHNYMDYSTDVCYTQFTAGQDARMDNMVTLYKPSLLNAAIAQTIVKPAPAAGASTPALRGVVSFRGAQPNPFQGATTLRYALPQAGVVSLRVYNVAGQLVRTLVDGEQGAGEQSVEFRANELPAGMYFTALRANGVQLSRSVLLVR